MALLVEIANSYVSGVTPESFICFVSWGTTESFSYLLFISVFWGLQVCFWNYVLDNTLDNDTPDGDNGFDDKNDDNNNHNSDNNNVNK